MSVAPHDYADAAHEPTHPCKGGCGRDHTAYANSREGYCEWCWGDLDADERLEILSHRWAEYLRWSFETHGLEDTRQELVGFIREYMEEE